MKTSLSISLVVLFLLGSVLPQQRKQEQTGSAANRIAVFDGMSKLLKRDRETLARAYAEGKTETMLVIAAAPGTTASVANQITVLGGKVRYRDDEVDYLRARIPIGSVERIARLQNIESLNVDAAPLSDTSYSDSTIVQTANATAPPHSVISPPDRNTPPVNAYLATGKIGVPQFIAQHPTFDGRGVTIGLFEGGIPDLLSPELQTAATLDGKPARKLIDILDAFDPVDDDDFKISMAEEVACTNGQFIYRGTAYAGPGDAHYQIGLLNEADFNGSFLPKGDLNLDDNPPGRSRVFAVLWNKTTNTVWVDTNQNHKFDDETPLTDYNVRLETGILGKDNPSTSIRKTAAFAITADARNDFIRFFPTLNSHATATASAAAGRGFFGGNMNGAAPGAKVISIMNSFTNHGLIEGMILAMKNPNLDLVSVQIGSIERFKDGTSVVSTIWNRLIDRYKKPIFISASNTGPGISTMSEIAFATNVISTGGYVHRDTWLVDEGLQADTDDYVANLSARGPRQDGGFKPDIIAPSLGVYSSSASRAPTRIPYQLPPGYTIAAGTSEANPMAAGAAALLISAAKQTGVPYDAERLKRALKYSARLLPDYAPHEQGDGLVQVPAAWDLLQKNVLPVVISSQASVKHVLSEYLKTPDQGPGIYEREGWTAGQRAERTISFTRRTGSATAVQYKVQWLGNDGTFSSSDVITLPLNGTSAFQITVSPKTAGVHSAILRLLDAVNSDVIYEVLNTIVAAEEFSSSNGFLISGESQLSRYPGYQSYFFKVPKDTAAFKFEMTVAKGNLRSTLLDPTGKEFGLAYSLPRGVRPPHLTSGKQSRTVTNPEPGVWEVIVVNHDFSDVDRSKDRTSSGLLAPAKQVPGKFTYVASVYGVEIQSRVESVEFFQRDKDQLEVGFVNRQGSFVGAASSEALGSGYSDRPFFKSQDPPRVYEIDVPPGTETLRAQINAPTRPGTDLDLYLYECTPNRCGIYEPLLHHNCKGDGCELKAFSIGPSANEVLEVANPNPGKWKIVIDPVSLSAGSTQCDYLDLFTHRAFGEISSDQKGQPRSGAQSWKEQIKVNVNAVPQGGRNLMGLIKVTSDRAETVNYSIESTGNLTKSAVERRVDLGAIVLKFEISSAKKSAHR
jgi:hypothetical protein